MLFSGCGLALDSEWADRDRFQPEENVPRRPTTAAGSIVKNKVGFSVRDERIPGRRHGYTFFATLRI